MQGGRYGTKDLEWEEDIMQEQAQVQKVRLLARQTSSVSGVFYLAERAQMVLCRMRMGSLVLEAKGDS
jgi:hypothetical protein